MTSLGAKEIYKFQNVEGYIESFDDVNTETFDVTYDYKGLRNQKNIKLLSPIGIELIDYYN
ncbi:hypothetical protein [Winogradskyella thalassocola]|uniref:Uncharacterized protein n=1 Tax=Winogradskyella thalassocola TaxID=262004 RepID=A0A1G7Z6Z2_9FLAO|nr:hypothetical protein [Winogradskyella thalassocola]SDH04523.1 hypothetical protein SAMN04489796_1011248 [Winogradskyella thalassocola]